MEHLSWYHLRTCTWSLCFLKSHLYWIHISDVVGNFDLASLVSTTYVRGWTQSPTFTSTTSNFLSWLPPTIPFLIYPTLSCSHYEKFEGSCNMFTLHVYFILLRMWNPIAFATAGKCVEVAARWIGMKWRCGEQEMRLCWRGRCEVKWRWCVTSSGELWLNVRSGKVWWTYMESDNWATMRWME